MSRLTEVEDVLFPVDEHPVFVAVPTKSGRQLVPVPDKKGIVNIITGRVLGVVSRSYRLVTNDQALDWAHQCCRIVFPETKPGEWKVESSDAPATCGHCFIDLVHNSTALDFTSVPAKDRPDTFGPFIRVTNSYNGLRALAFDIGFFRKVCKNGMILPESIIRFKFTHLKKDIGETIKFEIAHDRLKELKASFSEYLGALRNCAVTRSEFEPLFYGILLIREPKGVDAYSPVAKDWRVLCQDVSFLCDRYREELGENAYAVFNAVTEFASYPPENRCIHRDRHSFQRLAGAWLSKFSQECRQPGFELSEYLAKLTTSSGNGGNPVSGTPNKRPF